MSEILLPILWLAAAGLVCGLALAICARYFSVKEDPRVERILSILPGANCGGCGFPGCGGMADALVKGADAGSLDGQGYDHRTLGDGRSYIREAFPYIS